MQLVAYGAQDVYLTSNPQITFFKVVYRRYTNFAMQTDEQTIEGARTGSRSSVILQKNGDLVSHIGIRLNINDTNNIQNFINNNTYQLAWVRKLGHVLIKMVEIDIGGTKIDKQYGVWLDIWHNLSQSINQENTYRKLVGDISELTELKKYDDDDILPKYNMYIPMNFWFCKNTGLAIPLIAIQYQDVKITIEFEDISKLLVWTSNHNPKQPDFSQRDIDASLVIEHVFLDTEERRRFAQMSHEYLIEQIQYDEFNYINKDKYNTYKLNFSHPSKEIFWEMSIGAFNGESSNTFNNKKFLTYNNTDDSISWKTSIDATAKGILESAIISNECYLANLQTISNIYNKYTISINDLYDGNYSDIEIKCVNGHIIYVRLELIVDSYNDNTDATEEVTLFSYYTSNNNNKLPLIGYANFDYLDKIITATLQISIKDVNATFSLLKVDCINIEHSLTIKELSVPLGDSSNETFYDNRNKIYYNSNNDMEFTHQMYNILGMHNIDYYIIQPNNYGLRLDGCGNPIYKGKLKLNGYDRFQELDGDYFNYYLSKIHTRAPCDGINIYNFALYPEKHQPSGTCNFSIISDIILELLFKDKYRVINRDKIFLDYTTGSILRVFSLNYNVFRVIGGFSGIAYL